MLLIVGTLSFFWGLAGILNAKVLTMSGRHVLVWSFTTWGWVHMIIGALMVLTAFRLGAMQEWARWAAVVFAAVNAIVQIGVMTAFPLWSLIVIALDVVVIYQLTERWHRQSRSRARAVR